MSVDPVYFDLEDPINDYLPFQVNNPLYDIDITFLMLVTHTSSIQDNWDYMPFYRIVIGQTKFYVNI